MDAKDLLDKNGVKVGQRSSLIHPHDSCSVVAQQTFGTVFSLVCFKFIISKFTKFLNFNCNE